MSGLFKMFGGGKKKKASSSEGNSDDEGTMSNEGASDTESNSPPGSPRASAVDDKEAADILRELQEATQRYTWNDKERALVTDALRTAEKKASESVSFLDAFHAAFYAAAPSAKHPAPGMIFDLLLRLFGNSPQKKPTTPSSSAVPNAKYNVATTEAVKVAQDDARRWQQRYERLMDALRLVKAPVYTLASNAGAEAGAAPLIDRIRASEPLRTDAAVKRISRGADGRGRQQAPTRQRLLPESRLFRNRGAYRYYDPPRYEPYHSSSHRNGENKSEW